jgi:3-oxoacyl-[acyl-carrier-protein] synthase-1
MSRPDPIVFTGLGTVCGAGLSVQALWEAVSTGRSAIGPLRQWDAGNWPVNRAAEVADVSDSTLLPDRKYHKFISRTDLFGLYAADTALQQSGLVAWRDRLEPADAARFNDRSGVFVGSGGGAYRNTYDFLPPLAAAHGDLPAFGREIDSWVNPMWLLTRLPNNVLCYIGIRHGFTGTNACITNQCAGSALAVLEAAAAVRAGEADRAVAAAHDTPIEPETLLHYHRLGLLARDTVRPFDRHRDGTVLGEGAAAFVLEKEPDAHARHAPILGTFLGAGCTTEATGIVTLRPDGDGLARAIEQALTEASLAPNQVGLVVAHGNGTPASDASEARALQRVFGQHPPPVTAFKWALGHTIAASAALDLALALTALHHAVVPGVATLDALDPEFATLPISREPQRPHSNVALVLSRGFGGMNVALLVQGPTAP